MTRCSVKPVLRRSTLAHGGLTTKPLFGSASLRRAILQLVAYMGLTNGGLNLGDKPNCSQLLLAAVAPLRGKGEKETRKGGARLVKRS